MLQRGNSERLAITINIHDYVIFPEGVRYSHEAPKIEIAEYKTKN